MIGQNVKAEMRRKNISQNKLANQLKMSKTTLNNKLNNVSSFKFEEILRISRILDVDIHIFL